MNLPISSSILDLIIVLMIVLSAFRGYKTGLILRVYSLGITFISYFLAKFISNNISETLVLFELDGYLNLVGKYINNMLILLVLFFIIRLAFKLLNFIVKPLLYVVTMKIILIKQVNQLGGIFFGLIEGCIYAFFVLFFISTPLFSNGQDLVAETMISNSIVEIGPDVTNTMLHISTLFDDDASVSGDTIISLLNIIDFLSDQGMVSDDLVKTTLSSLFDNNGKVECSSTQYNEIVNVLEELGYSTTQIKQWVVEVNE